MALGVLCEEEGEGEEDYDEEIKDKLFYLSYMFRELILENLRLDSPLNIIDLKMVYEPSADRELFMKIHYYEGENEHLELTSREITVELCGNDLRILEQMEDGSFTYLASVASCSELVQHLTSRPLPDEGQK